METVRPADPLQGALPVGVFYWFPSGNFTSKPAPGQSFSFQITFVCPDLTFEVD